MEKEELARRYGLDLKKLELEQIKLSKSLEIKDKLDLDNVTRIGAIENFIVQNKIISAMVIVDKNYEIIEESYFLDKLRFPYMHGFENYRLLQYMTGVIAKIIEKPDILLIEGAGINHPRLGVASHLSLVTGIPTIGIDDKLFEENKSKDGEILMNGKEVGRKLITKEGSRPLYIFPGNNISVDSAYNFVKDLVVLPHKMPEPMHLAHKYAKEIKKELRII